MNNQEKEIKILSGTFFSVSNLHQDNWYQFRKVTNRLGLYRYNKNDIKTESQDCVGIYLKTFEGFLQIGFITNKGKARLLNLPLNLIELHE